MLCWGGVWWTFLHLVNPSTTIRVRKILKNKNFFIFLAADPSPREASPRQALHRPGFARGFRLRQGYAPTGRRGRLHPSTIVPTYGASTDLPCGISGTESAERNSTGQTQIFSLSTPCKYSSILTGQAWQRKGCHALRAPLSAWGSALQASTPQDDPTGRAVKQ